MEKSWNQVEKILEKSWKKVFQYIFINK